jgi:hypothetical protein
MHDIHFTLIDFAYDNVTTTADDIHSERRMIRLIILGETGLPLGPLWPTLAGPLPPLP